MNDTANPLEQLRQARVHSLLKAWAKGGRLSPEQVAEIRQQFPDFDPLPGSAPAADAPMDMPPAACAARTKVTAGQIAAWADLYGYDRNGRQLRKLIARGLQNNDACPLHDAANMPSWWARNMKQRCPEKILQAARSASAEAPPPAAAALTATTPQGDPPPPSPPPSPRSDLDEESLEDGEEVRIARRLVATYRDKLELVIHDPNKTSEVAQWDTRLKDAMRTLKEAKISDQQAKKSNGLYRLSSEVDQQIFGLLKLLTALHGRMVESIRFALRSKFPDLSEELLEALIAVVMEERERENAIFLDLNTAADAFALVA